MIFPRLAKRDQIIAPHIPGEGGARPLTVRCRGDPSILPVVKITADGIFGSSACRCIAGGTVMNIPAHTGQKSLSHVIPQLSVSGVLYSQ